MAQVMMYKRFERFWHWAQAFLIMAMLVTGFEIHSTVHWLGFELAVNTHIILAWTLIVLWIFAIFWHLTTGEWKQYIPSSFSQIMIMVRYYSFGIFRGAEHPFHKTRKKKHNPLQRMAYLSLHLLISPAVWISGLLYLFYASWDSWGLNGLSLMSVALVHTAAAFAMLTFLIAHIYLAITMSETPFGNLKAMITGYEEEN